VRIGLKDDDIRLLVGLLPDRIRKAVERHPAEALVEIVLDLGRPPEVRLVAGAAKLGDDPVLADEIDAVVARVGTFGADNRAGIERTLHRISAIRNRSGRVVGLTLRVGRAVHGTIDMLRDLVESGRNLLLLGPPGIGKTTKLREVARVLADELGKRVMVIDTSNEIAGDGDVPHPAIGGARRMQVPEDRDQHLVMIEAVENHMPEAIVVDEIGSELEAAAARTIAERGVQLVGTAHGNTLSNLVLNPTLSDLVGGVETVTLSDEEARRRGTPKTITERRAPPTFDVVVELVGRDEVVVHADTGRAVDRILAGRDPGGERRTLQDGHVKSEPVVEQPAPPPFRPPPRRESGPARIYVHALSRDLVQRMLRDLPVDARVVDRPGAASLILTVRTRADDPRIRRATEVTGAEVHTVKRGTSTEIRRALRTALRLVPGEEPADVQAATDEAEEAVRRVMADGQPVALAPRPARLRQLQHKLIARFGLDSASEGSEPTRHLVVLPAAAEE
jgi:stage III sporulation protein SpoIIIAA